MDEEFWDQRYRYGQTGWDAGSVTLPIKTYLDQIKDKSLRILVPGAGSGYEVMYAYNAGFKNVFLCEWSGEAVQKFKDRNPDFPIKQILNINFFDHKDQYDLILEQTFFCALAPSLRIQYARKVNELLLPSGKLAGVLFDFPFTKNGPPFGGSKDEYLSIFVDLFEIICLERCYNSIPPRDGNELFIILKSYKL